MYDIENCVDCLEPVHMDSAIKCVVCQAWYCEYCGDKEENGAYLKDTLENREGFVCKYCLEQSLEDINNDNVDDYLFAKEDYEKARENLPSI